MRQQQHRSRSIPDALDALDHQFDIDVRRRGGWPQHLHVGKVDADRVAGEDGAGLRIHQRHMVRRVSGRVQHLERAPSHRDHVAVVHGAEPVGGRRLDPAEERAGPLGPVDALDTRHEPRGVHEVRGSPLVHPDRRPRIGAHKRPHAAGVVQVDVRHHNVRQIIRSDPQLSQSFADGLSRQAWSGLDQRGLLPMQQVGRGHEVTPDHLRVDPADAGSGGEGHVHALSVRAARWRITVRRRPVRVVPGR